MSRRHQYDPTRPYRHQQEIVRDIDRHQHSPLWRHIASIDVTEERNGESVTTRMYERGAHEG